MTTLYAEIGKSLNIKRKGDESLLDFSKRAAAKVNSLEDPDWKELSKKVQTWSNEVLKAVEAVGKDSAPELPEMDGWPDDSPEATGDDEVNEGASEEDDSDDEADDDDTADEEEEEEEKEEATESETTSEESVDQTDDSAQEGQSDEPTDDDTPAAKPKKKGKVAAKAPVKAQKSKEKSTGKEKEKAMPAAKAAKSTKAPASQNARTRIDPKGTIKLLVKENPHREKTKNHVSFSKYKDGMTVEAAIKAKIPPKNIYYEVKLGNIKVIAPKKSAAA